MTCGDVSAMNATRASCVHRGFQKCIKCAGCRQNAAGILQ